MHDADLSEANLGKAALVDAKLTRSNLSDAILDGADLSEADLRETHVINASLTEANLRKAYLWHTNLHGANLSGGNLEGAYLWDTVFANVDMTRTRGLETCFHFGPRSVDHRTLEVSGPLPDEFLRGCGFQTWQIESAKLFQRDLTAHSITEISYKVIDLRAAAPILVGSIFISYTHRDSQFVDIIQDKLAERQVPTWRDIHDATAGRLDRVIEDATRLNPTLLLVLSKESVKSDWVEYELRKARELEKDLKREVLCPIALDDAWEDSD